jgi:putative SbcD/Mre11-related phosphoesterase
MAVEPVPGAPAARVDLDGAGGRTALVVADYHAGVEAALRGERGLAVESRGPERRERLFDLLDRTDADELVVLGDFMHSIGGPGGAERGEIEVLLESVEVPVTVVRGNHDGAIDDWIEGATVTDGSGTRLGSVGFAHGHTWPAPEVLAAEAVCVGHEHPRARLVDEVGGDRTERVWLRGTLDPAPFLDRGGYEAVLGDGEEPAATGRDHRPDLVVFPAYNDLSGGTWVNEPGDFLCPFLPAALPDGEAYLLDGARLGPYDRL